MDTLLAASGAVFVVYGILMLVFHLRTAEGTLLDAISVSWFGYLAFIALGAFFTGVTNPLRASVGATPATVILIALGTAAHTFGLYAGRSRALIRLIPRPASVLSPLTVWLLWLVCAAIVPVMLTVRSHVPAGLSSVFSGIFSGFFGAFCLANVLVLLSRRNGCSGNVVALIALAVCFWVLLQFFWSRRPMVALFVTILAVYYRYVLSRRSTHYRAVFMVGMAVSAFCLLLYLTASRGNRFYGSAAGRATAMLSAENAERSVGDLTINYNVLEFIVQQFPHEVNYLHGRGLVNTFLFWIPRALWPGKPISSGGVVTRMWENTNNYTTNLAPTILGEMYMNFGWTIGLVAMFITGRVVRTMNDYLMEQRHNPVVWLAWFLVIPDFASEWRGDLNAMTVQPLMRVCVFVSLAWLASRLSGDRDADLGAVMSTQFGDQGASVADSRCERNQAGFA